MAGLVLCAVLLADEWDEDPDFLEQELRESVVHAPSEPPYDPAFVLDVSPAGALVHLIGGLSQGMALFTLPVSVVVPVSPRLGLEVDVSVSVQSVRGEVGFAGSGSVGPQLCFSDLPLHGFYVAPKFTFFLGQPATRAEVTRAPLRGPLDMGPGVERAFLMGLDVGYQWMSGRWHFALGVGASGGYGYEMGSAFASPFISDASSTREQGPVFTVNLNLIRVGFAP